MRFISQQFRNFESRDWRYVFVDQENYPQIEAEEALKAEEEVVKRILKKPLTDISQGDVHTLRDKHDVIKNNQTLKLEFESVVNRLAEQKGKNWARRLLDAIGNEPYLRIIIGGISGNDVKRNVEEVLNRHESDDENEKKTRRINKILENPLHFTLAGVRFLEEVIADDQDNDRKENDRIFKRDHKIRFINLIVYSYESTKSVVRLSKVVPPRILLEVCSTKHLWKLLPPALQGNINEIIKQNISEVEKAATTKDPKTWSKVEVSKICSVYRLLYQQGFPQERLQKISEGLTEWIAHVYRRDSEGELIRDKKDYWETVSSTEKLLILEIRKVLGDSAFAGGGHMKSNFEKLSREVARDLITRENNPDLLLVWDLIEDIPKDYLLDFDHEEKKKLEQLLEYGNASRFLQTVDFRGNRVLSRVEFEALEEINTAIWEAPEFWDDSTDRMKRRKPIDERMIELDKQKVKLSLSSEKSIEEAIEHMRKDEPQRIAYEEKRKEKNKAFNDEDQNGLEVTFLGLRSHFGGDLSDKFAGFFTDYDAIKAKEGEVNDKQETLISIINDFRSTAQKEKAIVYSAGIPGVTERKEGLFDLEKDLKKYEKSNWNFKKAKEKVQAKAKENNESKIKAVNDEITRLKGDYDADSEEEKVIYDLLNYFDHEKQKATAKDIKKKYFTDLEERVQTHRLHSDDLDVLWYQGKGEGFKPKKEGSIQLMGFRDRIADVVFRGNDSIINSFAFDSDPEKQNPKDMVRQVEAFFGGKELLEKFQKLGEWGDLVENPQIRQEIIRGVVQHFREDIFNVLGTKIPRGVERDKFWNVMRQHFAVRQPFENTKIYESYQEYENNHQTTNKIVEGTRQKYEQMSQGYNEKGKQVSEENYSFHSNKVLNFDQTVDNLSLQTSKEQERVKGLLEHFVSRLEGLKDKIKTDDISEIDSFVADWGGAELEIMSQIQNIGRIADNMGMKGINDGEKSFLKNNVEEGVLKEVSDLVQSFAAQKGNLTSESDIWVKLKYGLEKLGNHLDFNSASGVLRNSSEWHHEEMRRQPENIEFLKKLGLFGENGENDAETAFNKMKVEYDAAFTQAERGAKNISRKVRTDISNMEENKFMDKYGHTKESMEKQMQDYDSRCADFNGVWKDFQSEDFFKNWIRRYNGDIENIPTGADEVEQMRWKKEAKAKAIDEFSNWKDITKSVEEMGTFIKGYRNWLDDYKQWKKDNGISGAMKRVKWQSFSMRSVYEIIKQFMETLEKRRRRREDMAVGNLGAMIFGDTIIGKEFSKIAAKVEDERISEWKSVYGSEEPWNLREIMYGSNDTDEVKACIDLLIEKGFFRWDDPRLLFLFNKLQNNVIFLVPEDLSMPYSELKQKLYSACRGIWPGSADRFREWESSFDDSAKKAQGIYTKEFDDLEHNKGERKVILINLLQAWGRGQVENIDPARFEAYLYQSFASGKLNGQPDPRWFFLVMGLTVKNPKTKQTLLSRRVLDRFQGLMTQMPPMEFLIDNDSHKKDGLIVPPGTPGAKTGPWKIRDYELWKDMLLKNVGSGIYDVANETIKRNTTKFFYQNMIMSGQARGRFDRVQISGKGKIDHDDGAMFSATWDFETMKKQITEGMDTTGKFTPDFWRNVLAGYDLYFRQMQEYITEKDQEWKDNPGWPAHKEQVLKDVGNRLKAAFMLTQAMSGNYRQQSAKMTMVFDQAKWAESNVYSICARESKEKINYFIDDILEKAGQTKYKTLLDKRTSSSDPEFDKIVKMNEDLYSDANDTAIFQNTGMIEQALGKYVSSTGGFEKYFTGAGADYDMFVGKRKSASGGLEEYLNSVNHRQTENDEGEEETGAANDERGRTAAAA